MKLVRVTQLEKFRRFISGQYDYETEQNVIDCITQEFKGNNYTYIGTAFHKIVEGDTKGVTQVPAGERTYLYYNKPKTEPLPKGRCFNIDGHSVILDGLQCKVALDYRNEHPDAMHEVREYKRYQDIAITGCADIIDGYEIRDIKTKYSQPDDKDYINSCQWRFYMELFEADTFHFDLFQFEGYDTDRHGLDVRGIPLKRYTPPITCYYYPDMEADNRYLINEFLKWIEFRKLSPYLPDYEANGKP